MTTLLINVVHCMKETEENNLSQWPTWCTNCNTFITILYMFRAISCLLSGGQIVLTQLLVSSLTDSDDTRCCINIIWPPEDEQGFARNMHMYRIVINVLKFVHQVGHW